jgi:hypothetical protein
MDVIGYFWDPICDLYNTPRKCNLEPLSKKEALEMIKELTEWLEPNYRGMGSALLKLELDETSS